MTQPQAVGLVHKAIVQVAAELSQDGIGKDHRNAEQKFNFRGIDDVLNVLSPLLARHKLHVMPTVVERVATVAKSASGKDKQMVTVKVEYRVIHSEDGSSVMGTAYGEGMDMADKATYKAMSGAYKYWAIQAFAIPVEGTPDPDADDGHGNDERPARESRGSRDSQRQSRKDMTLDEVVTAVVEGNAEEAARHLASRPDKGKAILDQLGDDDYNAIVAVWPK